MFTGDRTGIVDVISGMRVYAHEGNVRMHADVNFIIRKGGELVLPQITALAGSRSPSLEIYGGVYGVRQLRVYSGSHAQLRRDGHSGCFGCASEYFTGNLARSYWFEDIIVKGDGRFEMVSTGQDVRLATQLHTTSISVENNGLVAMDTAEVFMKYVKVDYDARFDSSGRGWPAKSGPGAGQSGCAGGGAGHGRPGGRGYRSACTVSGCYVPGKIKFILFTGGTSFCPVVVQVPHHNFGLRL